MHRRQFVKGAGAAGLGVVVLGTTGCPEQQTVDYWAKQTVGAFEQALPLLKEILPNSVPLLEKCLTTAKALKKALETKATNAIDLLTQLTAPNGLFNQLMMELNLIRDADKRIRIKAIVGVASIALKLIAGTLEDVADTTAVGQVAEKTVSSKSAVIRAAATPSYKLELALDALKF